MSITNGYYLKTNILESMKKYVPTFNPTDYKNDDLKTLQKKANELYKNIHVDIDSWFDVNQPDENLIYKDGCIDQICFISTTYKTLFYDYEHGITNNETSTYNIVEYNNFLPMVISTHMSKSVVLPVMELVLDSVGIVMIIRDNFYDWNVSVESTKPITCDFKKIFSNQTCFCEGFPKDRIYERYFNGASNFTECIDSDYKFFTFLYLLRDYLYTAEVLKKNREAYNKLVDNNNTTEPKFNNGYLDRHIEWSGLY